ncbi:hypothetical protein Droror1_Dr00010976 [Drosera rotundifolia]
MRFPTTFVSTHFIASSSNYINLISQSRPISSLPSPIPSPPPQPPSPPSSPVPTHSNIAQLILDQKTPTQSLKTFRWASKIPHFTHNQSTYRAIICKLCTFRRFETAHELLDEMPGSIGCAPNDSIFVTMIRGLGRARRIKRVINVVDLVEGFGGKVSVKVCNAILDVLVKHDIDIAREFYRRKMMIECSVEGDMYTYGILMKGLCLTNRVAEGFRLLQVMKSRGVSPNVVVYNTLLQALCKNGKVGRARSLMNEMPEPNDVTYNLLISAFCKQEDLVPALVLLEKSFSSGSVPDVVTVTKVVALLCSVGRLNEAAEVLERVEGSGDTVDVVAYNTLIRGFCALGKAKVGLHFLKHMETKGCLPTVDTYNIMISGFCETNMIDAALDLFNAMETDGTQCNFFTYDILIRGLCFQQRVADAFKILELMEERKRGAEGHISPYNNIIYGLFQECRHKEAIEFLQNLRLLFPRAVDRSSRVLKFCEEGDLDSAKKIYEQMINEGSAPSVLVYSSLINAFCKHGRVREAFELMNEMISSGYLPDPQIYNALIVVFCDQGKIMSAVKLVDDMVGRGFVPDVITYGALVDALRGNGELERAVGILQKMVERGNVPDHWVRNALLVCSN